MITTFSFFGCVWKNESVIYLHSSFEYFCITQNFKVGNFFKPRVAMTNVKI